MSEDKAAARGKISIKDIANMAGVSVATVSRVINQNGRFSEETERRVLKIIEEYEYRPNELARGLRVDNTQIVGVIVPDITNEFFSQIARKIETELLKKGYMAIICDTAEREDREKEYVRMLYAMRIRGIIYIGGDPNIEPVRDVPIVYVDRKPLFKNEKSGICFIGSDNRQGGFLAGERLVRAGRKNIMMVMRSGEIDAENVRSRRDGCLQALRKHRISFSEDHVFTVSDINIRSGYEVTRSICEARPETDGIFYCTDSLAIGGLHYLNESGIDVPGQISVVGLDDIPISAVMNPPLTTVRQPVDEFANLAVQCMMRQLKGDRGDHRYVLPVKLIERGTV